jgi:hypothetical protein
MALEHVPRCQHIKVNGVQCGSPALRRNAHCYFHARAHHERAISAEDKSAKRRFGFPLLEDANSIQVALMKVIQMLGSGTLDHKTAGLMLYALQTASSNLRNARFETEKPTDVVIDEDTVDLTRIAGRQWTARDFAPPDEADERKKQNDKAMSDEQTGISAETRPLSAADREAADLIRRREQKRNMPPNGYEEQDSLAAVLLKRLGIPTEPVIPQENEHPDGEP